MAHIETFSVDKEGTPSARKRSTSTTDEQGETSPTPEAIDLGHSDLSHPRQLEPCVRDSVFGIVALAVDKLQDSA